MHLGSPTITNTLGILHENINYENTSAQVAGKPTPGKSTKLSTPKIKNHPTVQIYQGLEIKAIGLSLSTF